MFTLFYVYICCFILYVAYWFFSITPGIATKNWRHFWEVLQFSYSVYYCNNVCNGFRITTSQLELLFRMKQETLFQWMNLWCDIEWNIVIGLLIEPEIFSPYGGTFDTFWFPFYCDSQHVMKFERALGQFLVISEERLLQNITK